MPESWLWTVRAAEGGGGRPRSHGSRGRVCCLPRKAKSVTGEAGPRVQSRALETSTADYTQGAHVFTLKLQGQFHSLPTGQPFSCPPIGQLHDESDLRRLVAQSPPLSLTDHASRLPAAVALLKVPLLSLSVFCHILGGALCGKNRVVRAGVWIPAQVLTAQ